MTSFSRFLMLGLVMAGISAAPAYAAETYNFDPSHTMVNWQAGHFGFSHPTGKFPLITGTLVLDQQTPANSKVNVTIDMLKLVTGDPKFDTHLKSNDFFNVEQFKMATFVSKSVVLTGKDTAQVSGMLTLLNKTKPVTLDVKLNKIGQNMFGKQTAGFSATTVIKRSEFDIVYAIPGVTDEVTLNIEAEANLQEAAK